jgi:hypothetical protein
MRLVGLQRAALLSLFLSSAAACGGSGRGADGKESAGTLGTITATIGGRQLTWYVVSAAGGGARSTGGWLQLRSGRRAIAIAGFDTEHPPLASFQWDSDGMLTGYGDYHGSVLSVLVEVPAEPAPFSVSFPTSARTMSGVIYMLRASTSDPGAIHNLENGTLEVSEGRIDGDEARVEGTFAGTFQSLTGGDTVRITDGRFQASGLGPLQSGAAQ